MILKQTRFILFMVFFCIAIQGKAFNNEQNRNTSGTNISFSLVLPIANPLECQNFISRLYDPKDSLYRHFVTPAEFTARFGPSDFNYQRVIHYALIHGLTIDRTYANRMLVDVSGSVQDVEALFNIKLQSVTGNDGGVYHYAVSNPLKSNIAINSALPDIGVYAAGLDNLPRLHTHLVTKGVLKPRTASGALTPSDIRKAYNIPSNLNGTGQSVALVELSGYRAGDPLAYAARYGLPLPNLVDIYVDSYHGAAYGAGSVEAATDIEMLMAMAPGLTSIRVYQAPNNTRGILDCYAAIANDNAVRQVSTSWGSAEDKSDPQLIRGVSQILQQMAAQGMSVFAASGDNGAYDDGSKLSVDDPASQPYVTGVGGTSLTLNSDGSYQKESAWYNSIGGGGGGYSRNWSMPLYQKQYGTINERMVPDVSLNADPFTGYMIYCNDPSVGSGWVQMGGTSASAPLWAAFTALLNQNLASSGLPSAGFLNPVLYQIAGSPSSYQQDFNDINDNSNIGYVPYSAVNGYDVATGLGSMNGANLIHELTTMLQTHSAALHTWQSGVRMVSVPYDYTGTSLDNILNVPGIVLYHWNQSTQSYIKSSSAPCDTLHQGVSYWTLFRMPVQLLLTGRDYLSGKSSTSVTLSAGWNMIGNPYNRDLPLSNITITDMSGKPLTDTSKYVVPIYYTYDPIQKSYIQSTTALTSFTGYWLFAKRNCKLIMGRP